ncbi:hypothetical protein E2562_008995 [Oryza meyeriana var. granulata]|uniref:Uncharacterized protein n=1 Tax=Oryza meyeriana var. granulata TaxID=110450 RepID=A0A6G1D2K4_9ORYZ|nr:hypothetical protein E2562_008995 [Oryza meyeriana var. granulata]
MPSSRNPVPTSIWAVNVPGTGAHGRHPLTHTSTFHARSDTVTFAHGRRRRARLSRALPLPTKCQHITPLSAPARLQTVRCSVQLASTAAGGVRASAAPPRLPPPPVTPAA